MGVQRNVVPRGDGFERVGRSEWLEKSKRLERAGHRCRFVRDSDGGEPVLEHREVEARVVGGEDDAVEQTKQIGRKLSENRCGGDIRVRDPVHLGCLARDRARRPNEAHAPFDFSAGAVEPKECDGDDLVQLRVCPGRLAIEDGVTGGRSNLRAPPHPPGNRVRGRKGHVSTMSPGPDGALTSGE